MAASAAACPPLLHRMNGRWSGCLAPTLSSRSLTGGPQQSSALRTRTSALVGTVTVADESSRAPSIRMQQQHNNACAVSLQQRTAGVRDSLTSASHSSSSIHSLHLTPRESLGRRSSRATRPDTGLSAPMAIVDNNLNPEIHHVRHPSHSRIPGAALPLSPISASPSHSLSSVVLSAEPPACRSAILWDADREDEPMPYSSQPAAIELSPVTPRSSHDNTNGINSGTADNNGRQGLGRPSSLLLCECTLDGLPHTRIHHCDCPLHLAHHRRHRHSYASSMTGSFSGNISAAEDSDIHPSSNNVSNTDLGRYEGQMAHRSNNNSSSGLARIDEIVADFRVGGPFDAVPVNGIHDSAYGSMGLGVGNEEQLYTSEAASARVLSQPVPIQADQSQHYHNHPIHTANASSGTSGTPSAAAIASIFSIGQPAFRIKRPTKRLARIRRISRRLISALACALHLGHSRQAADSSTYSFRRVMSDSDRMCSDALLAGFSAESSLIASTQLLERMRSMQTMSFRVRADRVHLAQSQLLHCVYILFTQQVQVERRQSRHYRFYLPEDDQTELDRGFSESVLFAAQALSRGFQIRGTEMFTQALREPAWALCSVWTALRHVLHARGHDLLREWARGTGRIPASGGGNLPRHEALVALCDVLEDFDEAWVRFERDLCFAYFGLSNTQIAGIMDPNSSGDALTPESQHIAQEEEFSLLVVLISETLQRCLDQHLATRDQMESMDPVLVIALPRLAILHAIARNGVEGLRFIDSDDAPMFWWFRDYRDHCRRVSDAAGQLSPALYGILQRMLIAEDADIVLSQCSDDVFAGLFSDDEKACGFSEEGPMSATSCGGSSSNKNGVQNCCCSEAKRKALDLESIIDSPRTTRSLSIDDCISSMYAAPPPQYLSPESGKPVTTTAEAVAVARSRANSTGCLVCALPDSDCISSRIGAACDRPVCRGRAASSASANPLDSMRAISLASTMSTPILNGGCYSCMIATPTSLMPSQASTLARIDTMARRKAKIDSVKAELKRTFVDVCAVADSLHSGSFARPFRMALELVFRMNIADDGEAKDSPQLSVR
ncbi:hypothetical protein IWW48_001029 [Coemansia sp. RSA 1200]|nr:hypothetical protein IWW48_001029 [Coemansia sp. RSA 1200]